jgi:hypothetical protein
MYVQEPKLEEQIEQLKKQMQDITTLQKGALSIFIIFFPIWTISTVLSQWLG